MRITERCGCGASLETDGYESTVTKLAAEWRRGHQHSAAPEPDHGSADRDPRSTTDLRTDFGFTPDHPRPVEAS